MFTFTYELSVGGRKQTFSAPSLHGLVEMVRAMRGIGEMERRVPKCLTPRKFPEEGKESHDQATWAVQFYDGYAYVGSMEAANKAERDQLYDACMVFRGQG
jgi:hypothetical protein